jgi:hypothetical protein
MTAAFLGSSSGICFSTFPTKSAPISADLVKIPPPIWQKRAAKLAPNPKPTSGSGFLKIKNKIERNTKLDPVIQSPVTEPPLKAIWKDFVGDYSAVSAVFKLALTLTDIPKKAAAREIKTPKTEVAAACQPKVKRRIKNKRGTKRRIVFVCLLR